MIILNVLFVVIKLMKNKKLLFLLFSIIFILLGTFFYIFSRDVDYSGMEEYSGIISDFNKDIFIIKRDKHPLDKKGTEYEKQFVVNSKTKFLKTSSELKTESEYKTEIDNFKLKKDNNELVFEFPSRYKNNTIEAKDVNEYIGYYVTVFYNGEDNNLFRVLINDKNKDEDIVSIPGMEGSDKRFLKGTVLEKNNDFLLIVNKQIDIMTKNERENKYKIYLESLEKSFSLSDKQPNKCRDENSCTMKDGLYVDETSFNSIKIGDSVLLFCANKNSELFAEEIYVYR